MQAPISYPAAGLPTQGTPLQPEPYPPSPPAGFDAWLALAMAEGAPDGDTQQAGPADFGLWGVAPDGAGRLDLDAVAVNLHATLAVFAGNFGKACRQAGLRMPPPLRLQLDSNGRLVLGGDPREVAVLALMSQSPTLARQCQRLLAGFCFVRCGNGLRAWQRTIGQIGPARLSGLLAEGEGHTAPTLSLYLDGHQAQPEEAAGRAWRPLAGLDALCAELLDRARIVPPRYREHAIELDQLLDPASAKLRAARTR